MSRSINQLGFHQIFIGCIVRSSVAMRTSVNQHCFFFFVIRSGRSFPLASICISYSCRLWVSVWGTEHMKSRRQKQTHTHANARTVFSCSKAAGRPSTKHNSSEIRIKRRKYYWKYWINKTAHIQTPAFNATAEGEAAAASSKHTHSSTARIMHGKIVHATYFHFVE